MYPERMDNLTSINQELQRRIQTLLEEKTKLESTVRKEKKLHEEKIASVEESVKVMEEMLQEANFQKDVMGSNLKDEQKRSENLENRLSAMEKANRENSSNNVGLKKQLGEFQKTNSELISKMKVVEKDLSVKDSNEKKLANIIVNLERQLKEVSKKVAIKEENNDWKEKFLSSEEKLKLVLNKKKATHSQQICQLQDKMNAITGRAKEELQAKDSQIELLKRAGQEANGKIRSCEDQNQSLVKTIKEKSISVDILEGKVIQLTGDLEKVKAQVIHQKGQLNSLEAEKKDLISSRAHLIKSAKEADESSYQKEKTHFSEMNDLKMKFHELERRQFDELGRMEDSHNTKLSGLSAELEKTSIRLKVADDLNRKTASDVTELQDQIQMYEASNKQLVAKLKDMNEELQDKDQEMEEVSSRCEDAERRLNEASNAISVENFQHDNLVSWRTRYEYQINFLTEKLRRVENGISTPLMDKATVPPIADSDDEVDENEEYLRLLDTDTSELIDNLKSQVKELEMKTSCLESKSIEDDLKCADFQTQLLREKEFQRKNERLLVAEAVVSNLLDQIISDVIITSSQRVLKERISELEHLVEVKESEVLWVRTESEETVEALRKKFEEKESSLSAAAGDNARRSAFLQCGIMPDLQEDSDLTPVEEKSESGLQRRISELEKTLEQKEDHFSREVEVLKLKNNSLAEKLDVLQSKSLCTEENEDIERLKALESDLERISVAHDKLLHDNKQKDEEFSILNVSLEMEKEEIEETQRERDELREENTKLQGKMEAIESSLAAKLLNASKQYELEIATLKSELERAKVKLKQSQLATIKVQEDLFIEHREILDGVRSLSTKKRKRLFEDIQEKTKRLRENEDCNLLDDTLDESINDPKDDIGVQVNENVEDEVSNIRVRNPQVLLTSWVD